MPRKKPNISVRYASLAGIFAAVCAGFIVVLAITQLKGPQTNYYSLDDGNTRTVTVTGLRGQIYDRNGVLLVGNSTTYDLIYEYGAMPESFKDVNASLLEIISSIKKMGEKDKLCDSYFPIDGFYPNVRFIGAISDTASTEYYYFSQVLERNGLNADITAEELAEYYINRCKLSSELYSIYDVHTLMELWYEMDRVGFGAYASYTIASDVSAELMTYIEEKVASGDIEGVNFKTVSKRVYNEDYIGYASHILGRVGKIQAEDAEYYSSLGYPMDAYVGVSGCEYVFESILHGQDGQLVMKYDDDGNVIEKYYAVEPISGNDVYLTIDIELQKAAEDGLAASCAELEHAEAGALTAIDPNTGAVLALASYPTYDLSRFSEQEYYDSLLADENKPLLNRALQGAYAPGSTYKIGVALAALEVGEESALGTAVCNGQFSLLHQPGCNGVHGEVNIYDAIQESCNVFFYSLGYNMTIAPATDYTTRLGLGVSTGIELSERAGTVAGEEYRKQNKLDAWTRGDDVSAAIGQSDHSYTPLQLSIYMASIVNGGTRYSAHLLDSTRHFHTKEALSAYTPTPLDSVSITEESYKILIDAMGRVVSNNAEVKSRFTGVPVAVGGKTGTAEVNGQVDNALFCGFAPLNDPKIVVSCIIEEGEHGYYAAEPVAKVMEIYFRKYQ